MSKNHSWPRIVARKNKAGVITSYHVDCGYLRGKRIRSASFATLGEAQGAADHLRITRRNEGTRALTFATNDRNDAQCALDILRPHNVSLQQAAEFYIANVDVIRNPKPVGIVFDEMLEAKRQDGKAKSYVDDLIARLGVFCTAFTGVQFTPLPLMK